MLYRKHVIQQGGLPRRDTTDEPVVKKHLLELTSVCEEVANIIEDNLTGG
jgi:hypothetical protein